MYFTLKASKIIRIDGDKSFAPEKNALRVSFIEPKFFLPITIVPTTNANAIKTMPKPKSAKNGTNEDITITSKTPKNKVHAIFVF